jgi:hypothetical protein
MKTHHAIIIALGIAFAGIVSVTAQQRSPNAINGCQYIAAGITLSDLQTLPFRCDINGRLMVTTTP